MTAIHQFIPSFAARDAIGAHGRQVQRLLRELGIASEIYAGHIQSDVANLAYHYEQFSGGPETWCLYHLSIGSPIARYLLGRDEPILIDHHNITPPRFFEPWEPLVTTELRLGLRQMDELSSRCVLGLADSEVNRRDLARIGYRDTVVAPILLDLDEFNRVPDPETMERLGAQKRGGGIDWLFVGRLAPNKAQHSLVAALAAYRRAYDPNARLHLVGAPSSDAYLTAVRRYVSTLGLDDAVNIVGSVSGEVLAAYFASADVFTCLSQHEGFCVPLLEAMHHRLPIVALGASAVPETIGGAGILLSSDAPATVASAVSRLASDDALSKALIAAGRLRLAEYALPKTRDVWRRVISSVIG